MARSYTKGEEPVPGYRLIEPLGRGGFGEVWKANGPGGIPVALKIIALTAKHGSKELRAIQRVKAIRHPNLIPITAYWLKDRDGNVLQDAMTDTVEFGDAPPPSTAGSIRGTMAAPTHGVQRAAELIMAMGLGDRSLSDRLEECLAAGLPGIPPEELLDYIEDAARAIDHLNSPRHDLGSGPVAIQHCDIKPQNIMIVGGAAQVCDFGLARVLGDLRSTTAAMSPAYAAPECLKDNTPSEFTDQYSLAVSYVELRTGVLPFNDESYMGVVNAHLNGHLDFSRCTEAEQLVLRRATAVEPKERYPTTLAMVRALRQAWMSEADATAGKVPPEPTQYGIVQPGSEIVPGYILSRSIARGMHDEVWEAAAPGGKPVAIVLRKLLDTASRDDFIALDILKGVEHDRLTEPHAYWLLDSNSNIVTDEQQSDEPLKLLVVVGKLGRSTLRQRLEECRQSGHQGVPLAELLGYMRQLADAIDFLNTPQHRMGDRTLAIYHRDIRPVNIVLHGSSVRLGNFGLARVCEAPADAVITDSAGVHKSYAAPELFDGCTTRWSDQYAFAITYYFLRTGNLPFDLVKASHELIEMHRSGRLELGGLPPKEQEVIARATAVIPEDRYKSCREMMEALGAACDNAPELTAPPAPVAPPAPSDVSQTRDHPLDDRPAFMWPEEHSDAIIASTMATSQLFKSRSRSTNVQPAGTKTSSIPPAVAPAAAAVAAPRKSTINQTMIPSVDLASTTQPVGNVADTDEVPPHEAMDARAKREEAPVRAHEPVPNKKSAPAVPQVAVHPEPASGVWTRRLIAASLLAAVAFPTILLVRELVRKDDVVAETPVEPNKEQGTAAAESSSAQTTTKEHTATTAHGSGGQHSPSPTLDQANALLATAPADAIAQFEEIERSATSDDLLRHRAILGRARAAARLDQPDWASIRERTLHVLDAKSLAPGDQAIALVLAAIALTATPDVGDEELDQATEYLERARDQAESAKENDLRSLLDEWELSRADQVIEELAARGRKLPAEQGLELARRLAALNLNAGAALSLEVQHAVSELQKPDDFAAMLAKIEAVPAEERLSGWLWACRAECLLEHRPTGPSQAELADALSSMARPEVARDTGMYGQYVRAVVSEASAPDKTTESVAHDLFQVFTGQPAAIEFVQTAPRRSRLMRIFEQAGSRRRTPLQPLDLGRTNPFQNPAITEQVYQWTITARRLLASGEPASAPLLSNLLFAAWHRQERDAALAGEIADQLINAMRVSELGSDANTVLLIHAQAQDATRKDGRLRSLDSYAQLLERISLDAVEDEADVLAMYERLLQPAIELSQTIAEQDSPGDEVRQRMAKCYASAGRLIARHQYAAWKFDVEQKTLQMYDRAVELDSTARNHVGRAYARSAPFVRKRLSLPADVLTLLQQDAEKATQSDPSYPGGHGLTGYVLLHESRSSRDPERRTELLKKAVEAYERAVDLCNDEDDELPTLLTSKSTAYTELSSHTLDVATAKEQLLKAKADAERATKLNHIYPEYAWGALGNALEDLAWIVGETKYYPEAVAAFTEAIARRENSARPWLDRGRCQYKRVAFGGESQEFLAQGISDVNKAIEKDPNLAESYYWLGNMQSFRGDLDQAEQSLAKAANLSREANDANFATFLAQWALIALKQNRYPDVRERANQLKEYNPIQAALILGQAAAQEGKPEDALAAFGAALPSDLADADESHVPLLIARSDLISTTPRLAESDLQKAKPQAIQDADRAAELSNAALTKANALASAAKARIRGAIIPGAKQAADFRVTAIQQLRDAIKLAPQHPHGWYWRELFARQLQVYIQDSRLDATTRDQYRKEAISRLDEAITTAPATDRSRIGQLRRELKGGS